MDALYDQALSSLSRTPSVLKVWLGDMPEHMLRLREKPRAWHAVDILEHLIHAEQTDWIPRLKLMADHHGGQAPTFEPFNREGHTRMAERPVGELLGIFEALRGENLDKLNAVAGELPVAELKGIHPELGLVNGRQLLATWAAHDQTHIYQIARNFTSPFAREVGPWAEYLRIVNQNSWE